MQSSSNQDQFFLKRLTEITEANLANDQFGVSELAKEFGKSRSYIHRQLKSISNESLSQFIRRIRLEKGLEILRKNESSVAEIAYNVGFGSPSYFIKCFHDFYGHSPREYVNKNEIIDNDEIGEKQRLHARKWWIVISFLLFVVIAFFINKYFFDQTEYSNLEKSIAVLPLKNTKGDQETQFLADGIMEDILNRLSHVQGLKVKSRISAEIYKETDLSLPEIAKEMDVSYVLEGTIMKENDKVRIYVQLIEAKSDDHVWTKQYDRDLKGIFTFVSDVSRQIAEELEIVLSPTEIKQVEKRYTENTEAYILYQKGRFFWHRRTEEGLNNSVKYYNQALKLDSTYALAYAGLANTYFNLTLLGGLPKQEGYEKCSEFAVKAMSIDNSLALAHMIYGALELYFNWNWDNGIKRIQRAIELNPNLAYAYQGYSQYLCIMKRWEEASENINKALELDPNSLMINAMNSIFLYREKKYNESLIAGEKVIELDKTYPYQYWINFLSYIHLEEDEKAINELLLFMKLNSFGEIYTDHINKSYAESGIKGLVSWSVNWLLVEEQVDYYYLDYLIAQLYALTKDKDSTFLYLKKEVDKGFWGPWMKHAPDFEFLHGDPRFNALLEKMNMRVD